VRALEKSFPGVRALRGVDLELHRGEVLALVGENGAGKSTLIKILGGAHRPDAGSLWIAGREEAIATPADAQRAGIAVIYQELNLVPELSAAENIFLGQERTRGGFIRRGDEVLRAREIFQRLGVAIDPRVRPSRLSAAEQQVVEIARALATEARVIIMDEPSATLTPQEVEKLFQVVRELTGQGIGVIYVSHRLDEIFQIADRVLVLRDGSRVGEAAIGEVSRRRLIEMMVGRSIENEFPARRPFLGEERLVVDGLRRGDAVRGVSFAVRRGEVLGLTGLVGAGRTETARLIAGADRRDAGSVRLDGRTLAASSPRQAIRDGICLLTEDRKGEGLVPGLSVRENFGLPNLGRLSRLGFVRRSEERRALARFAAALGIKAPSMEAPAWSLSGGNQQKLVLARWLERDCEVLLLDEPTRGIDVGAKYEIYVLIDELAARGKAILLISSELPEVLALSDRVLVMHEGRIRGEITDPASATQEAILQLAIG
jgi:ABC-type sugar transport system ATPase subunit